MSISPSTISQDFPCSGKPVWAIANSGIVATDLSNGNKWQQKAIPFGSNWVRISGNNIYSAGGGTGDVTGPGSSTDNNVALFSGATGKVIKDSGKKLSEFQDLIVGTGNVTDYYGGDKTFHPLPAPGTGDVVGPASSVNNNIALFDGVTGKLIKDSGKQTSIDGTLSANSDDLIPTQKAIKTYADALVVGLWDDRGNFDASGGAYPAASGSGPGGAILKGDIWTISVAGTLPVGQDVEIGDVVRALVDTPGNTQANWAIGQNNIGYVPENQANKSTDGTLSANSDTLYPSQKAVKTYVDANAFTDEKAQDAVGGIFANSNTIQPTYNDGGPSMSWDVINQMSITSDASGNKLVNDSASPGNWKVYRTDGSGTRNWNPLTCFVLGYSGNVASTNTAAEELLWTLLIPAGLTTTGDVIRVTWMIDKTSGSGTWTTRVRLHTATGTGGTAYTTMAYTGTVKQFVQTVIHNSGASAQVGSPATALASYGQFGVAVGSSALNTASDMYINLTSQKVTGTDATALVFAFVEIIKYAA